MKIQPGINTRLGDYKLTSDPRCYTLEKVGINADKESENYGQETYSFIGYYTSFKNVMYAIMENEIKSSGATTIEELKKKIEQVEQNLISLGSEIKLIYVCEKCGKAGKNE